MANWSNPQLTSTYTNFLAEVKARDDDLAVQFSTGTISNQPDGAIKWDSSANVWKKWSASGSSWGALTSTYAFPAITATTGTFSSSVAITGTLDASSTISGTAFIPDGSSAPANGMYLPSSNTLGFSISSGQKASLNATGLRLGTGTASCKLDVDGGIKVAGGVTAGSHGYGFGSNDTDGGMYSPADDSLTFKTNDTRRVSIVGNKTGINVDNPDAHLHVEGGGAGETNFRVKNNEGSLRVSVDADEARYQADQHRFLNQSDNSTWATLNSVGLAINCSPTSYKLHVTGNSLITGALEVTGGLTAISSLASDLDINAANKLLYQSSNRTTSTLPQGTDGQFLKSKGAGTPEWATISTNGEVPIGGIIIWSGAESAIAALTHWKLCDGANGTPNLLNKFVMAAGGTYSVGATGGFADAVNVSHTHTTDNTGSHGHGVTVPGHSHTYTRIVNFASGGGDASNRRAPYQETNAGTTSVGTNISIVNGGSHAHTIASSGVSGTGRNIPPYYALCYIMRVS